MKKLFIQGAGSPSGASPSALRGVTCSTSEQQLPLFGAESFPLRWRKSSYIGGISQLRTLAAILLASAKWSLPLLALLSVPASRLALVSADLALTLLAAAAVLMAVCFTVQDWRKEGGV